MADKVPTTGRVSPATTRTITYRRAPPRTAAPRPNSPRAQGRSGGKGESGSQTLPYLASWVPGKLPMAAARPCARPSIFAPPPPFGGVRRVSVRTLARKNRPSRTPVAQGCSSPRRRVAAGQHFPLNGEPPDVAVALVCPTIERVGWCLRGATEPETSHYPDGSANVWWHDPGPGASSTECPSPEPWNSRPAL